MYYTSYYLLVLPAFVFALIAQMRVNSAYNRYGKIQSRSMITGADVARSILSSSGIYDVSVNYVDGRLTDHYDPRSRVVNLSKDIYNGTSIAAIAVAAHECGHVLQDVKGYSVFKLRMAIIPATRIGSSMAVPLFLVGMFLSSSFGYTLMNLGILLFSLSVVFQLITLPVEYNASLRAKEVLVSNGHIMQDESKDVTSMLNAAAMTYLAALAVSVTQLLRLVLMRGNRRN